jgi:O-antigen/teichoic acid export membrane protein
MKALKMKNNVYYVFIEKAINLGISFVFGILCARILGPTKYGILNYAYSIIIVFNVISMLGIDSILVKELICNKKDESIILGTSIFIRFIASIICILLTMLFIFIINNNKTIIIIVFIESLSFILNSLSFINDYCYAHMKYKYNSIFKIISYLIVTIYKLYILLTTKNLVLLSCSIIIDAVIINTFYFYIIKSEKIKLKIDRTYLKQLLIKSYPFLLSSLLTIALTSTDKIMIGNLLSQKDVGIYGIALVICNVWSILPDALITIYNPVICKLKVNNNIQYKNKLILLYRYIFYIGLFSSIITIILSKYLIPIIFSKSYLPSYNIICIGVWYSVFLNLSIARKIWLVNENKNKYNGIFLIYSFSLNIILNFIFIKKWGLNGVIFSSLFVELINIFILPLIYNLKETTSDIIKAIIFK